MRICFTPMTNPTPVRRDGRFCPAGKTGKSRAVRQAARKKYESRIPDAATGSGTLCLLKKAVRLICFYPRNWNGKMGLHIPGRASDAGTSDRMKDSAGTAFHGSVNDVMGRFIISLNLFFCAFLEKCEKDFFVLCKKMYFETPCISNL